jgi:tetratricopeptide (TPR) repeat protein
MEVEEGLDNDIETDVEDIATRPSPPATEHPKVFDVGPPTAIQKRGCSPRIRPKAQKLEKTLHEQIARLGASHPDVASTLTDLAMLLIQAGERDAPVKLLREALTIWKLIGDQAAIARTLHKLGDVSSQQNQFNTALAYHREALKYERSLYGTCHLEIASTLNMIGTVHASLEEFDFAMTNHQHALQILKHCVGEDLSHPLVAQTLICIGAVYYKERNSLATIRAKTDDYNTFIEAGMLDVIARAHEERGSYRMAIAFFEEKLQLLRNVEKGGMDQHEVVEALTRLGTLSRKAGVYLEALDYYKEAANIQSVLGRDQVEMAKHLLLTGTVHYHLGHFSQSLKLLKETLSILQATVGNDQQVLVAETVQRMGMVQIELCEFDSAMKAFGEALRIQSSALGMDHPATLQTRLSVAIVLMNQGELDSSIEQFTAILGTQSRVHGPKHPNLARTMYYIARAYEWKGDIATATKFYEESFFMAEDFLGHDHPVQAATLHGIADLQQQKRRYKKSLQILGSVLDIRKETLGERHIDVAMTLCSVASCQAAMGRFEDSTIFFDDALLIAKEVVGSTHLLVAQIYVAKGALFLRKCQFQEARDLIKKGLEIYQRSNVVEGHPRRVEAERMLERVQRDELLCV